MVSETFPLASIGLEVMHLREPDENILWIFVVEDTESESLSSDSEGWYSLDWEVLSGQSLTESVESDLEGDGEFPD